MRGLVVLLPPFIPPQAGGGESSVKHEGRRPIPPFVHPQAGGGESSVKHEGKAPFHTPLCPPASGGRNLLINSEVNKRKRKARGEGALIPPFIPPQAGGGDDATTSTCPHDHDFVPRKRREESTDKFGGKQKKV